MTEERITSLIDTVEDCSVEEQEMIVEILEDLQGKFPEVDQVLVRKFKALDHLFGGSDLSESSWRFFPLEVSTGKFPLENLPDHVREIAKKLYYE
ncbi:hypothetical protein LEP1GSC126_2883 [Leptospira kirschneri str. 200801774]|uniref:hypothetical protein n=1 Tax=Leptospira kirschneri TaxID=29507 RepID=UPI0002BF18A5|nr:hypothetical protein [Leptospira kirschneri]EMO79234.1 hypothetical protein LEP1GSC126_2883 [Leptospira kirschneri str. 200801774]